VQFGVDRIARLQADAVAAGDKETSAGEHALEDFMAVLAVEDDTVSTSIRELGEAHENGAIRLLAKSVEAFLKQFEWIGVGDGAERLPLHQLGRAHDARKMMPNRGDDVDETFHEPAI